jgi:ketosteroid isomerase-like protein
MSSAKPIRTVNQTKTAETTSLRRTQRRFTMCPDRTSEERSASQSDFDGALKAYRQAQAALVKGDPKPVTELFSRRDDVTLANPLGPPRRGPAEVEKAIAEVAAQVSEGSLRGIEEVSRYSTPDVGYVVQLERTQARLAGNGNVSPIALRATMIFRREGDTWKVAHRHADPIVSPRSITTVINTDH